MVEDWSLGSFRATGILEPMTCMSYFPVIVKTAHIREMREYLARYHNKSFDQAFKENINSNHYSQFGIMCTYLWGFHKDEYSW
jgi:hypothetical protein